MGFDVRVEIRRITKEDVAPIDGSGSPTPERWDGRWTTGSRVQYDQPVVIDRGIPDGVSVHSVFWFSRNPLSSETRERRGNRPKLFCWLLVGKTRYTLGSASAKASSVILKFVFSRAAKNLSIITWQIVEYVHGIVVFWFSARCDFRTQPAGWILPQ